MLLPLNLTEKHHLLFKFYHVSCSNAKTFNSEASLSNAEADMNGELQTSKENKSIETLIGYAWLPIFKNGRLMTGEKNLPVAQTLCSNYLSFEQIGMGQSVGPSDIKWVENMKPLFRVHLVAQSSVHTIVSHIKITKDLYYLCKIHVSTFIFKGQSRGQFLHTMRQVNLVSWDFGQGEWKRHQWTTEHWTKTESASLSFSRPTINSAHLQAQLNQRKLRGHPSDLRPSKRNRQKLDQGKINQSSQDKLYFRLK